MFLAALHKALPLYCWCVAAASGATTMAIVGIGSVPMSPTSKGKR